MFYKSLLSKKMHKNYKNEMITGNTIRFGGNNNKTKRNFVIIHDEKHKIGKYCSKCACNVSYNSSKKYKNYDLSDY